nr:hypothetical protein [Tanacetum cinerariifolium]
MENVTMRTKERRKTALMKHNAVRNVGMYTTDTTLSAGVSPIKSSNDAYLIFRGISTKDNNLGTNVNSIQPDSTKKYFSTSFANMLQRRTNKKIIKIHELHNPKKVNGAAVAIPLEAVEENTILKKDTIKFAPVWVKLHHVPIVAYSEIGLSLITTQLGKPIMLDSYTSNMCLSSWGRNTYARALVEFSVEEELKKSIIIAIPLSNEKGHSFANIDIEYEGDPPRCDTCKVFDHVNEKCPKNPKEEVPRKEAAIYSDDGFTAVKKKYTKARNKNRKVEGVRLTKPSINLQYRKVEKGETSMRNDPSVHKKATSNKVMSNKSNVPTHNSFNALTEEDETGAQEATLINDDSESEEVDEELVAEDRNGQMVSKGASTPIVTDLCKHKLYIRNRPWSILGDFNASLFMEESTACGSKIDIAMREFRDCVDEIEVMDVQSTGLRFTWTQKPKGVHGILKKLDLVMANLEFNDEFISAYAILIYDHSPSMLCIATLYETKPKRFKFFNILTAHDKFLEVVKTKWGHQFSGFHMFYVKAKVLWLKEGDSNFAYFHKVIKSRTSRSRIDTISNSEGVVFENNLVHDAFVSHYEIFLRQAGDTSPFNSVNLFKSNGTLLRELNHTIIALLPKVKTPTHVTDYRPISCCNVLFKCISKIIANRIKHCLMRIISTNQSTFILGRSITDNILLTQELMHNYHLDRGTPRCAFKVDIQKAYDTVDWDFLRTILHGFGFHDKMISWIMECVTTTSYSISINGSLHGYFKGKRDQFKYHRYCSKMGLNLCFADDLFLFAYGDVESASIIKHALDEFKNASVLVPSLPKSTAYFCNVLNHVKLSILQVLPFEEGKFIWSEIGSGEKTNLWFDKWSTSVPLASIISPRDISRSGFTLHSKVSNVIIQGLWVWPPELLAKYHILNTYTSTINNNMSDCLEWHDRDGKVKKFSVSQVWSDIRHRDPKVDWYHMVWFPSGIPRQAINLWLIVRRKLKTQDMIPHWEISNSIGSVCSLCEITPDSHKHLFFECPFAQGIWNSVKGCAGIDTSPPNIYDIILSLMPTINRQNTINVVAKLVVASSAYYVWQERN